MIPIRARWLALAVLTANCQAQLPVVDLQISGQVEPTSAITKGESAVVRIAVKNLGPDSATRARAISSTFLVGGDGQGATVLILPHDETAPCLVEYDHMDPVPGNPAPYKFIFVFGELEPGDSVECAAEINVFPNAPRDVELTFTAFDSFYFSIPHSDEANPSDNQVVLPLQFQSPVPQPYPAVTVPIGGKWALGLLALAISLASVCATKLSSRRRPRFQ